MALLKAVIAVLCAASRPFLGRGVRLDDGEVQVPVWVWWDYPPDNVQPAFIDATRLSWKRFAPADKFEFRYVNHSTIQTWLPDWPEETSRMYPAAVSDVVRAGLLAKHGGVYLDSDMLLAAPLAEITDKLQDHDVVTYANSGQNCHEKGTFSSNFMAARKGNALHTAWYEEIKKQLKLPCSHVSYNTSERACCYMESGSPWPKCRIPWAMVGEGIGHPTLKRLLEKDEPQLRIFCFNEEHDDDGFAPCPGCLWASVPKGKSIFEVECDLHGANLECERGMHINRVFSRRAYHLANAAIPPPVKDLSLSDLEAGPYVLSRLLREKGITNAGSSPKLHI